MNTMQTDLTATLEGLRTDLVRLGARILLWVAGMLGLTVAILGSGMAFLGFLIGLTG